MVDQIKTPRGVSADKFLDVVRAGVFDAMRELMTSGTSTPHDDFYSAVRDGVREAVRATVTAQQLRVVPDSAASEPNAPAREEEPKP
jgi:hypothetical protein